MAKEPTFKEKVLALIEAKLTAVVIEENEHEEAIDNMKARRASIDHKKAMLEDLLHTVEDMPMKALRASIDHEPEAE